jgi:Carboxypeptidase regulatory-like domain
MKEITTGKANDERSCISLRWSARCLLSSVVLLLSLSMVTSADELTGTVRSKSGKPLANVSVTSQCERCVQTKTDANGFFRLPAHGRVVFFRYPGFRPLSKILDSTPTAVQIVLEESAQSEWKVPSHQNASRAERYIGDESKLAVPRRMVLKKVQDADYLLYVIHDRKNKRELLEVWFGLNVSRGYPPDDLLISSSEFTERSWMCDIGTGVDLRGRLKSGERWRWISLVLGMATYRVTSEEAANSFDRIIDSFYCDAGFSKK